MSAARSHPAGSGTALETNTGPVVAVSRCTASVTVRDVDGGGGGGGDAVDTVTLAVPVLPSLVALITAVPAATAVTAPIEETVATAAFELVHVTTRPLSGAAAESRGVAVKDTVFPIAIVAVSGVTFTEATALPHTRTRTVPTTVPTLAATVVTPGAMPVIRPAYTLAMVVSALDQTAR
jgi:hypothetical protein